MANVKISALPAATTPLAGTEVLPIVQSGITSKVSAANLTAGRSISASDLTLTNALPIAYGGTGQITANASFNALAPSQTGNSGKYLTTDGTNTSWATNPLGTVTSVAATAGTGISVTGSPITTSGTLNIVNTAPDQTVVLTASTGISVTGTYPSFTITNTSPSSGGTVTSVTGTSPVVSSGGNTPAISMPVATTSVSGYLSSTDWTTFNNKQAAGTYVNSVSGTTGRITSTGGVTPIIDLTSGIATAGTTGSATLIPVVTIDTYGRVTSITTAANPQGTVTSVTGTAPVVSSGGATPAISMAAANTTTNGYLTSTDWNTFNGKSNTNGTVTSVAALTLGTTGTDLSSSVATGTTTPVITLNVPTASATNRGVLSSADWTTFNNKGSGTVTSVTGTAPVVSSGGATPAISMAAATASVNGYLTSADWTTFNNKGSGTVTSVALTAPSIFTVSGSPITSSGTLALTYSGTALPILNGGTGQTTAAAAYNALTPLTTTGDIVYEASANTAARLGIGSAGQVLTVVSGVPAWATSASTIATNLAGGTTGAVPYQSTVATTVFLNGNTSTTPNFYTSTGTGTVAQAPTLTSSTGTGSVVLNSSPSLTTPTIGGGGVNFSGSTSGTTNFKAAATAGTTTITMPATTGTMALTSDITVTSIVAGTGISVSSASGAVTVTATGGGVTSIVAGNGISINASTGAVTVTNSLYAPSFNSVGTYAFVACNAGSLSPNNRTSGTNYSAGTGSTQLQSGMLYYDVCSGTASLAVTNNLSGTWKWMSANSPNLTTDAVMGIAVRVA